MNPRDLKIIGLTGGIGTGKSSVADFFKQRGILVIDADELSREAVFPGSPGLCQVVKEFGETVLLPDGTLNRAILRQQIFTDPQKRLRLENILHPEIRRLGDLKIRQAVHDGHDVLIYMAPLLLETGGADRVHEIWVVTLNPQTQLKRLMQRDNIPEHEAEKIISAQMPLKEKESKADLLINNNGTMEETVKQLEKIWQSMVSKQI